jgi:hypothetical protein
MLLEADDAAGILPGKKHLGPALPARHHNHGLLAFLARDAEVGAGFNLAAPAFSRPLKLVDDFAERPPRMLIGLIGTYELPDHLDSLGQEIADGGHLDRVFPEAVVRGHRFQVIGIASRCKPSSDAISVALRRDLSVRQAAAFPNEIPQKLIQFNELRAELVELNCVLGFMP